MSIASVALFEGAAILVLLAWVLVESRGRHCPHLRVRCTHGDEILARGLRRRICLDCGRPLDGPLPDVCSTTGEPHGR